MVPESLLDARLKADRFVKRPIREEMVPDIAEPDNSRVVSLVRLYRNSGRVPVNLLENRLIKRMFENSCNADGTGPEILFRSVGTVVKRQHIVRTK